MENKAPKNYAKEDIPDPSEMISKVEEISGIIATLAKYQFQDLFIPLNRKGKTEYNRNTSIWGKTIQYNTWDKKVKDELEKREDERRKKNEVKGIYIFYEDDTPVYVGISRTILRRLKNHFLGKTHFEASLVYLMLRDQHDKSDGIYMGKRAKLPVFKKERESFQEKMRSNWRISIIPIENNYEMYITEFYIACYLKTKWNSFETH